MTTSQVENGIYLPAFAVCMVQGCRWVGVGNPERRQNPPNWATFRCQRCWRKVSVRQDIAHPTPTGEYPGLTDLESQGVALWQEYRDYIVDLFKLHGDQEASIPSREEMRALEARMNSKEGIRAIAAGLSRMLESVNTPQR